jgi:hypothetical protein
MSIKSIINGVEQVIPIPAPEVQVLDLNGNYENNDLENILKEVKVNHNSNVDKIGVLNESLSDMEKQKADWVIPEQFGAVGDGVTDDTNALQNAISYCQTNKATLKSKKSKIYAISNTLSITDVIKINFDDATIKAISSVSKMIDINVPNPFLHIENINLDMNSLASEGFYVTYGQRGKINNINIINNTGIGLHIKSGYELLFNKIWIKGKTTSSMGLKVETNDCDFTDIYGTDNYVGIYTEGVNTFAKIHFWIWDTSLLEGSIYFKVNGSPMLNQCCGDTYHYLFYVVGTLHRLAVTQLYTCYHPDVYKAPYASTNPYLFYFDTDSENSAKYISLTNSYLTTVNSDTTGIAGSGQFSNIDKTKFMGYLDNNTYYGYSDDINLITSSVTLASGFTQVNTKNTIVKKNKRVILELYCKTTTALTSSDTIVGTLPWYLGHATQKYFTVGMGISGYAIDGIGYGYIDGTTLKIKSSAADTGKFYYYMINVEYDTQ